MPSHPQLDAKNCGICGKDICLVNHPRGPVAEKDIFGNEICHGSCQEKKECERCGGSRINPKADPYGKGSMICACLSPKGDPRITTPFTSDGNSKPERCEECEERDEGGLPCRTHLSPEAKVGWEEEFEDKFVGNVYDCIPHRHWREMKGEVFAWIRYLLSQAREEEHRKCVELIEKLSR